MDKLTEFGTDSRLFRNSAVLAATARIYPCEQSQLPALLTICECYGESVYLLDFNPRVAHTSRGGADIVFLQLLYIFTGGAYIGGYVCDRRCRLATRHRGCSAQAAGWRRVKPCDFGIDAHRSTESQSVALRQPAKPTFTTEAQRKTGGCSAPQAARADGRADGFPS